MNKPQETLEAKTSEEESQVVRYDLDELIAGITPQNAHSEINFGWPVGKEFI